MSVPDTTLPSLPDNSAPARRRWPVVSLAVLVVIFVLVVVAGRTQTSYYVLVPGNAIAVSGLISVPEARAHPLDGRVLLTDVGVNQVNYLTLVPYWLDSDAELVKTSELTGNLPASEFYAEGNVDMAESQMTAKAVALRQLGYPVPERDAGVTVYVIDPSSPAWNVLHVGDVITAINGVPTPDPAALVTAVHRYSPGDQITISVGSIGNPSDVHDVKLTLGSLKESGQVEPFIGIGDPSAPIAGMGTQPIYSYPFPIKISSDDIGGPSAGLAFTLGLINTLSGGHLTGGHSVAATGTIHPDGTVGDVGGVKEKTVAVERAGATLFLVPPQEYTVAEAKANASLKVVAVSSLSQAIAVLERHGGSLGTAAAGPPPGPAGHSVPYDWQDSPWT